MTETGGNRALAAGDRDLYVFTALGKGKPYRFEGVFAYASHHWEQQPDSHETIRKAIVFHLVPIESGRDYDPTELREPNENNRQEIDLDALRAKAFSASRPVAVEKVSDSKRIFRVRSEQVRRYVLARAAGVCEKCKKPAPFQRADGTPYLEPHHLRRLADDGPDDPRTVAGICPNCHRKLDHAGDGPSLNENLQEYVQTLEQQLGAHTGPKAGRGTGIEMYATSLPLS